MPCGKRVKRRLEKAGTDKVRKLEHLTYPLHTRIVDSCNLQSRYRLVYTSLTVTDLV